MPYLSGMILKRISVFFFFLLSAQISYAQDAVADVDLTINNIKFEGLKKTKEVYLLSIIHSDANTLSSQSAILKDVQRLKNLSNIANAQYRIDTIAQENVQLTFIIEERRTLIPIINFGGIKGNIWFTLGATENNLGGYGNVLLAFYQNNNGRHSGQFYFRKPRLLNNNWGYSITVNKWSSLEPLFFDEGPVQYLYDNNGAGLSIIRNFGLNRQIELGTTFFKEIYNKANNQELINPPGPDDFSQNKFLTKLIIKQDFLNYHYFYLKGHELILNYQNVYNFFDATWFNSLQFQAKIFFRPSPKLNIASRLKLGISTNNDSPFAPFVADSHINIRGIGNRIDRGTAQVVFNLEARYTVYHKKFWGGQIVAFTDSGTWRNPGGELSDLFDSDLFRQFVGIGTRVIYQKIFGATLRIDYGVDLYDTQQRGFVLGLEQYF